MFTFTAETEITALQIEALKKDVFMMLETVWVQMSDLFLTCSLKEAVQNCDRNNTDDYLLLLTDCS